MRANTYFFFFILFFVLPGSSASIAQQPGTANPQIPKAVLLPANDPGDVFFEGIFKNYPGLFDSVLKYRADLNLQIIYTEINRGANGIPELKNYYFNRKNARYFYPASSIKLPVALLALQKLNELKAKGINRNTTMLTEAAYSGETPVYNDPNTRGGKPSIAQYIKKMFLVSDNDAFNRLYEFVGQEYMNDQLQQKGYKDAQVLNRLGIFLTDDENRHTNPINFYDSTNRLVFSQPMAFNTKQYARRNDTIGNAYYSNELLINKPMNFSNKNRISLDDLHTMLVSLIFPEKVTASQRFNITDDDRRFVLKYMSEYPGESVYPSYDTAAYHDAYSKYILFGATRGVKPKNIRIFNKSGEGYGQLTDIAYVVDLDKKIEFMVSATIYCNKDGILNDDEYDYDNTGYPFLKNLGKALYDRELKRKRNIIPDLSAIIFTYDK